MLALPQGIVIVMYTDHFQLDGTPFSIAPDPRYLYMSAQHREALAHLLYGVDAGGGFVLLTGEVGAGKTTVCRCFLQQVASHCRVAYIFNPRLSAVELLQAICQEFAIALPQDAAAGHTRELVDALNRHLLESHARGEHSLLIIDEAQNLSADVLEQLRLLTNLETNEKKLLQIILIGQPELRQLVQQPQLEQLAQRIIARYHLGPLSAEDCRAYIVHRLAVAGARSAPIFTESAMRAVHRASRGVPRKINLLCDRALLAAYARNEARVDEALVRHAVTEIFAESGKPSRRPMAAALALVLVGVGAAGWAWYGSHAPAVSASIAALAGKPLPTKTAAPLVVNVSPAVASAAANAEPVPVKAAQDAPDAVTLQASDLARVALGEEELMKPLAQAWLPRIDNAGTACPSLPASGLFCYRLRGGLREARELDRPFLMKLKGEPAKWLLVREVDAVHARVQAGDRLASVRLPVLESAGAGEAISLWRMEQGFRSALQAGMRGADVEWLATQLARWSGTRRKPGEASMDAALIGQVRQFQQLQGLDADGLVGPRTWMKLNAVAGVAEPRLQPSRPQPLPALASR